MPNLITDQQPHGNAGCIVKKKDHILVVKLRRSGKWDMPAGKPLPDEIASQTAEREAWEETGIKIKVVRLLSFIETPQGQSIYIYEAVPLDENIALNTPLNIKNSFKEEIIEARFLPINNLNENNFCYPIMLSGLVDLFNSIV